MTPHTYDEWEQSQNISPVSPEAYYAELAWNAALESNKAWMEYLESFIGAAALRELAARHAAGKPPGGAAK